jgi:hypothetical protein
LPELKKQADGLRAARNTAKEDLDGVLDRIADKEERLAKVEKLRNERGIDPARPKHFEDDLAALDAERIKKQKAFDEAEGALAEVEGEVQKLTPVPDPSRPTWRQSEIDVGKDLGPRFTEQQSYLNGKPVPHGTEGSVRPDWVAKDGSVSVEVKNYDIAGNSESLIDNIANQAKYRTQHLPIGMRQEIVIDIRGQVVSAAQENTIIETIVLKSRGAIGPDSITFKR